MVNAQFSGGDGTSELPYQISTIDQTQLIGDFPSSHFELINDIDATATSGWNDGAGFSPVGNFSTRFTGSLNGNGHRITGLHINRPGTDYCGLFGFTEGMIEKLEIRDASVTCNNYAGILAGGNANGGTITEVHVHGMLTGSSSLGGLVGYNMENGVVTKSSAFVTITGGTYSGGFVGSNSGPIYESYSLGNVTNSSTVTGGFAGANNSIIDNSYSMGAVISSGTAGGFVGWNISPGTISQTWSSGTITAGSNVGAHAGANTGTISNSYWNKTTSQRSTTFGTAVGLSGGPFRFASSFDGFDFENTWEIKTGETYSFPYLKNNEPDPVPGEDVFPYLLGDGTVENPFEISDLNGLQMVMEFPAGTFLLQNNIDAFPSSSWNDGKGFEPIGQAWDPFTGHFDGGGYMITGLTINRPEQSTVGLFGELQGSATKIGLYDADVTGLNDVGLITGKLLTEGSITFSYATGSASGESRVGGLGGDISGQIEDSYTLAEVTATSSAGGAAGRITATGKLTRVLAAGPVSASSSAGGLAGTNSAGSFGIVTSYWNATTTGRTGSAGGGTALPDGLFRLPQFFPALDFETVWNIVSGDNLSYPYLRQNIPALLPGLIPHPFPGRSGSADEPFEVTNAAELQYIGTFLGGHFVLQNDIDASETAGWNEGAGFLPAGSATFPFSGALNGNGFKIIGLTINRPSMDDVGLFSILTGQASRFGLVDAAITGRDFTGSVSGKNLAGSSISEVFTSGAVSGQQRTGGITGENFGSVLRSYVLTTLSGTTGVGNLAGRNASTGTIDQSYGAGPSTGTSSHNALVGSNVSGGTVTNSYWNIDLTGRTFSPGGGLGLNDSEFRQASSFPEFNFAEVWDIGGMGNLSFPWLRNVVPDPLPGAITSPFSGNDGTPEDPYRIFDVEQLQAMNLFLNGHFVIMNEIDASETAEWNEGKGFLPIGSNAQPFTGSLFGDYFPVTGLTINRPGENRIGLFGVLNGSVSEVPLLDVSIEANDYTGGIAGEIRSEGSVTKSLVSGSLTGGSYVGGITGWLTGTIEDAASYAMINSGHASGGVVGWSENTGIVRRVFAAGQHTSDGTHGGVIGVENNGTSENNYWSLNGTGVWGSDGSATGLMDGEARYRELYPGFDFTNTWLISEGEEVSYPIPIIDLWVLDYFSPEHQATATGIIKNAQFSINAQLFDPVQPYPIATPELFYILYDYPSGHFIQDVDLDLSESCELNEGAGIAPIGNPVRPHTGSYNGNGFKIDGLCINRLASSYVGMFGVSSGSLIGVTLINSLVKGGGICRWYCRGNVQWYN